MSIKSIFKCLITILILAAPCAAQTKSGSQSTSAKTGTSTAKPSSSKTTQNDSTTINAGRNAANSSKPSVAAVDTFEPSLKISNLNLVEASREQPGTRNLIIAWTVILNRFDGVLTNRVNSQDVQLLIERSKAGSKTVNQSLPATSTSFSLPITVDADESVKVTATVRARCTVSSNGVTSAVTLFDSGSVRRDPNTVSSADTKKVEVTILKVANEDARPEASTKGTRRVIPVRVEWKTRPWQDAKLIALRAELTSQNTDGSRTRVEKVLGLTQTSDLIMLELPYGALARDFKLRIVATCSFDDHGKPATATSEAIKTGTFVARNQ